MRRRIGITKAGRSFLAVRDVQDRAVCFGVEPGPSKLLAYALSGAIVGVLFVREGWNWMLAVALACAVALVIGLIYGIALTRFGMPSFVASLSGLLAFLGLQLAILGDQGSVNLPFDSITEVRRVTGADLRHPLPARKAAAE